MTPPTHFHIPPEHQTQVTLHSHTLSTWSDGLDSQDFDNASFAKTVSVQAVIFHAEAGRCLGATTTRVGRRDPRALCERDDVLLAAGGSGAARPGHARRPHARAAAAAATALASCAGDGVSGGA